MAHLGVDVPDDLDALAGYIRVCAGQSRVSLHEHSTAALCQRAFRRRHSRTCEHSEPYVTAILVGAERDSGSGRRNEDVASRDGWFEVGSALKYAEGGAALDVRGGISYANSAHRGKWFAETNDDALYVRRFDRDTLFYSQNRTGYTLSDSVQVYWNWNATQDAKREYWANTVETGPGVKWRVSGVELSANLLRGAYTVNAGNPHRPNYNDLRIGIWYAFSR